MKRLGLSLLAFAAALLITVGVAHRPAALPEPSEPWVSDTTLYKETQGYCASHEGCVAIAPTAARADVALGTALTSTAVIDHGDWQRLTDAGFSYSVCGFALRSDGAKVYWFPTVGGEPIGPCEVCAPGGWALAPATCSAQWKTNRGL